MAASPTDEADPQFTSFSNPNYRLHQEEAGSDATANAVGGSLYEDVDNLSGENSSGPSTPKHGTTKRRKKYAHMDLMSMGIDPSKDPVSEMKKSSPAKPKVFSEEEEEDDLYSSIDVSGLKDSVEEIEDEDDLDDTYSTVNIGKSREPKVTDSFLTYYASLEESLRKRKEEEGILSGDEESEVNHSSQPESINECVNSPDSNDSGIQVDGVHHVKGPVNDDVYAVVTRPIKPKKPAKQLEEESSSDEETLPQGWEKHEDEDGPYYWHVKSGTIQREAPPPDPPGVRNENKAPTTVHSKPTNSTASSTATIGAGATSSSATTTSLTSASVAPPTVDHLQEFEGHAFKYAAESLKALDTQEGAAKPTKTNSSASSNGESPIRFAVRSLGWVQIAEEDLTPERSSKAVNKCIIDLSLGRNDINDVVGRWGDGKDLYMDLDSVNLKLIDPQDFSLLNSQLIQSIRVWGVGRDNGRDFAYVARDKVTRVHKCHVFRCDTPARHIANTLKDICKKIMLERTGNPAANHSASSPPTAGQQASKMPANRPTNLPNLEKADQSFPTPMEEPKKTLRAHYLGSTTVHRPTGVDVLNAAIEKLYTKVSRDKWALVNVAVAPSTITITEHSNPDKVIDECRVRFLSFLGIAIANVKMCAFIMHTAQDRFVAHVFHCDPSAGALCKTIEAACKLRYQKCLDAHATTPDMKKQQAAKVEPQAPALPPNGRREKIGHIGNHLKQGVSNVFGGMQTALSKARNKWSL